MAMITCPECTHKVSDQAAACPRCGCPIAMSLPPPLPQAAPTEPILVTTAQEQGEAMGTLGCIGFGIIAVFAAGGVVIAQGLGGGRGISVIGACVGGAAGFAICCRNRELRRAVLSIAAMLIILMLASIIIAFAYFRLLSLFIK